MRSHTEQYTLFYDPATGGHSREEAAGDLVAAFHSVLDFGEDVSVAIKGDGVYRGAAIDFVVRAVEPDASGTARVRVQFTRAPGSWKVRTVAGWLTPSPDRVVEVHIPSPTRPSP